MFLRFIIVIALAGSLAGCATAQSPTDVNQLQIKMAQIEHQLNQRSEDIAELKYVVEELVSNVEVLADSVVSLNEFSNAIGAAIPKVSQSGSGRFLRVSVSPQEVQMALKNSGHYMGDIDGNLGSGSQRAIRAFQKDHDMTSDGIIGKKTWAELKNYLD